MTRGKSNEDLGDFLALRGITEEWLQERCEELQTDSDDASTVLELLSEMIRSGIVLPPVAANLVSDALLELANGKDARLLVGTAPTRGRPRSDARRHIQRSACLALLNLAGIQRMEAVGFVARVDGYDEREVQDIVMPEITGDFNNVAFLLEMGAETLSKLLNAPISNDAELSAIRAKLAEFIPYHNLE